MTENQTYIRGGVKASKFTAIAAFIAAAIPPAISYGQDALGVYTGNMGSSADMAMILLTPIMIIVGIANTMKSLSKKTTTDPEMSKIRVSNMLPTELIALITALFVGPEAIQLASVALG